MRFSSWWERPLTALGLKPAFVEGVSFLQAGCQKL